VACQGETRVVPNGRFAAFRPDPVICQRRSRHHVSSPAPRRRSTRCWARPLRRAPGRWSGRKTGRS